MLMISLPFLPLPSKAGRKGRSSEGPGCVSLCTGSTHTHTVPAAGAWAAVSLRELRVLRGTRVHRNSLHASR